MDKFKASRRARWLVAILGAVTLFACGGQDRPWVLPDPASVTPWFGENTEAELDGNVLEIRGVMNPEYIRRGGLIWERSGPYFYLFNVHVQELLEDYPDLAGIRARTFDDQGVEVARAMLERSELSESRWREALARASVAQRDGSTNPRVVEELIEFGEEHTEYRYRD